MGNTMVFNKTDVLDEEVEELLKEVATSLEAKGYSAIDQIVGYLLSGDPGYISSYQDARTKIQQVDRAKIIEVLLQEFYKNHR